MASKETRISVVVPIYNVERYLGQCLDSILSQTFRDFQLILVDDGSTDDCLEICRSYEKRDPRVTVLHQKNAGLSAARNTGIEYATGEYITFIDSDDFVLPDMLEKLYSMCVESQADMSCCGYIRCGAQETAADISVASADSVVSVYTHERMKQYLSGSHIGVTAWGKLYKRTLFANVRYPVGKYHEDVFTTYQLVHLANKVATTNQAGYIYRRNDNSITTVFSPKRLDGVEGKLHQAEFLEQYYPELSGWGYAAVVGSSISCLRQMEQCEFDNQAMQTQLIDYCKKYLVPYLKGPNNLKAKCLVLMICMNYGIGKQLFRFVRC